MNQRITIIVILLLCLVSFPHWPWSSSWGYLPFGGLGGVLLFILILMLCGVL